MNDLYTWPNVETFFINKFNMDSIPELESMLFLIGVRELGRGSFEMKKDDKMALIHLAVCKVLEPHGFYELEGFDENEWSIYINLKPLPELKLNEQTLLLKQGILDYFISEKLLE